MTNEFEIAVHALVFLNHKQQCMCSELIADNICTNPARVRKVLAKLKASELIDTKEGKDGGCYISKGAQEIRLLQVRQAIKEIPVYVSKHTGAMEMECPIASGMSAVMDDIYKQMNDACDLVLDRITIADIDKIIFHE